MLRSSLPLIAAAPSLCALIATASLLLIVAGGGRSLWLETDMSLAEAALTGDVGRLYRLLEAGHSPTSAYHIRSDYRIDPTATMLTPIEAGFFGDNTAIVALLLERGVADDPGVRDALRCMARKQNKNDIEALLEQHGATQNDLGCP